MTLALNPAASANGALAQRASGLAKGLASIRLQGSTA